MKRKSKLLAAAIAMLALSTAASVTGTVAWFTAANTVSVSGMNIQAEVEQGIVISNEAKSQWKTSATASHNTLVSLIPTSTADASSWYHAYSDDANNATDYTDAGHTLVSVNKPTAGTGNGIGTWDINNTPSDAEDDKNVYLLNRFYIQGSAEEITGQDIFVKEFTVSASKELSKSLRVLVKNNVTQIFEPVDGASTSYSVNNSAVSAETIVTYAELTTANAKFKVANNVAIPAYDEDGTNALEFEVYAYFEGEDASCKSANATELEQLSVGFKFENAKHV